MKKIIFSLIAISLVMGLTSIVLAEETNTNTNTVNSNVNTNTNTINTACIQKAIEKKENAVIAALDKRFSALKTALEKRKTALVAAYGITIRKDRIAARLKAWTEFNKSRLQIGKSYKDGIKTAMSAMKAELKACKSSDVYNVETSSMSSDYNL